MLLPEGLTKAEDRRQGDLGTGDRIPVRPGRRGAAASAARAQRGPGRPLGLPTGRIAHRRLLGRDAGAAVRRRRPPERIAILGSAAGTTARAIGPLLPRHRVDAVEIDPAVTEIGRELFDLAGANMHYPHRRCPAVAAAPGQVRRDPHRCLPAALHSVLPGHPRVLRLGQSRLIPAASSRSTSVTRRSPPQLEKVLSATMRDAFGKNGLARPVDDTNTMLLGTTSEGDPSTQLAMRRCPARCAR